MRMKWLEGIRLLNFSRHVWKQYICLIHRRRQKTMIMFYYGCIY